MHKEDDFCANRNGRFHWAQAGFFGASAHPALFSFHAVLYQADGTGARIARIVYTTRMLGTNALMNGRLVSPKDLVFPLDDTDITSGYGCYETLKVRKGLLYLADWHEERLFASARMLGIRHALVDGQIVRALNALVDANRLRDCNIKVMLVGRQQRDADWYAFALPALFVPEGGYESGVDCLVWQGERPFPSAKSLSLLQSIIAFRAASDRGCWDALLVNRRGEMCEGTRTNIFWQRIEEPDVVYTPPSSDALEGLTRKLIMEAMAKAGKPIMEQPLRLSEALSGRIAIMLSSTSTIVAPVARLMDGQSVVTLPKPPAAGELLELYRSAVAAT